MGNVPVSQLYSDWINKWRKYYGLRPVKNPRYFGNREVKMKVGTVMFLCSDKLLFSESHLFTIFMQNKKCIYFDVSQEDWLKFMDLEMQIHEKLSCGEGLQ